MTTSVKIRTNGNYVAELQDEAGDVIGSAGPGSNVESDWINVPHGTEVGLTERNATAEEIEKAAQAQADAEQGE